VAYWTLRIEWSGQCSGCCSVAGSLVYMLVAYIDSCISPQASRPGQPSRIKQQQNGWWAADPPPPPLRPKSKLVATPHLNVKSTGALLGPLFSTAHLHDTRVAKP
jgi:hypothetical protein